MFKWQQKLIIEKAARTWTSLNCVQLFVSPWIVHGILQARILEWGAFPFSRGSSQPRDWTQVSCIAGRFFTSWASRETREDWSGWPIPSAADLPDPGIKLRSPALQADSLLTELSGKPKKQHELIQRIFSFLNRAFEMVIQRNFLKDLFQRSHIYIKNKISLIHPER